MFLRSYDSLGVLKDTDFVLCYSVVITDPEDPKFDLEKLLAKWEKEAS